MNQIKVTAKFTYIMSFQDCAGGATLTIFQYEPGGFVPLCSRHIPDGEQALQTYLRLRPMPAYLRFAEIEEKYFFTTKD